MHLGATFAFCWCLIGVGVAIRNCFEARLGRVNGWTIAGFIIAIFCWPLSIAFRSHILSCIDCQERFARLGIYFRGGMQPPDEDESDE